MEIDLVLELRRVKEMCRINPKVDFAFKKFFGSAENKDILKWSDIMKVDILNIEYNNKKSEECSEWQQ